MFNFARMLALIFWTFSLFAFGLPAYQGAWRKSTTRFTVLVLALLLYAEVSALPNTRRSSLCGSFLEGTIS
jgi:hypothetical protein